MDNLRENKPIASVLITSMRAMGYSFESAVADVIDNSISAQAQNIYIRFPTNPIDCYIAICDDGYGMTNEELFDAMKYGSKLKSAGRSAEDLGRFGLGLKSASLSQCRKLTVVSKKYDKLSAFCWDLDIIESKMDWYVIECSDEQINNIKCIDWLRDLHSGTVVVWENFDVIEKSSGNVYAELSRLTDSTSNYLSLIFHRFLNGTGTAKVSIKVNNFELDGLDPFLENHNKTNIRRKRVIKIEDSNGIEQSVVVQPYILPFQKDLTEKDKKLSGGIENYRSKQGFYVYRNSRLIVWGNWFGRHKDELTKHARIKVDIPNTLDDIWGIDIKKQHATIPSSIKQRLTAAVDDAMDTAIKAQTYRGRIEKIDEDIDYIWDRVKERGEQFSYHINRDSKIFDLIKDKVDDETWARFDMILDEIENAVPYQQIYIDKSQNKIDDTISDERLAEIEAKAKILISIAQSMGESSRASIIEKMFLSEPFNKYPDLKSKLLEE